MNTSNSAYETVIGIGATNYTPFGNTSVFDSRDRVFTVGVSGDNGVTRRDSVTVLKNAQVGIDINNFETNTTWEKLQVNGKVKASDLKLTGLPVHADEAAAIVGGLTTGDVYTTITGELRVKL